MSTTISRGAPQVNQKSSYEFADCTIYWPTDAVQLHNLVNYSFGDCWCKRSPKAPAAPHRLKVLHFGLWSLAEFFVDLTVDILQLSLQAKIVVASNQQIISALDIRPTSKVDDGINSLYRTLTTLCLMARPPKSSIDRVDLWSSKRMHKLLEEIDRLKLHSSIVKASSDVGVFTIFFNEEQAFRSAMANVALQQLRHDDELYGPVRRQLLKFWNWSGLYMSKLIYDFCNDNTSAVWSLPGMVDDAQRFVANFDRLLQVNGELAPLARLLDLPLVEPVRNLKNFPNLHQAVLVKEKAAQPGGLTHKLTCCKAKQPTNTNEEILAALKQTGIGSL